VTEAGQALMDSKRTVCDLIGTEQPTKVQDFDPAPRISRSEIDRLLAMTQ
jgi:hypothetical protein